ncbi:hypothetical protein A5886_001294 [Enterococcus sp. 8G7_MSG3316]|uniref:tRNA(Met) cytidine acetate ligase n=1 Tax=Candidatus Enterococcus testudinis TaxID=1834191 RepID=A0A242A5A3_9ENTE|nr:nucleotidyltransferase [Enterococcus sp. 8G7_MSG3316]OTN76217.1 hypothetical protein A5886_001294 [Enterococcus sp. 8G7_MSG3316]
MRACGIIVEYNPFHNGHRYHIEQAKVKTGADVVIAVMSGNFLQRGEPAVTDKWQRAEAALANGADLVVELPAAWAVQSADLFAAGAVSILQDLQCQWLCFGTDAETPFDYLDYAQFEWRHQDEINAAFQRLTQENATYSERMNTVLSSLYPAYGANSKQPNHILGMRYAKELLRYPQPMTIVPIVRKAAAYHSEALDHTSIASATAIRNGLKNKRDIAPFLPAESYESLQSLVVNWADYWPLLHYQMIATPVTEMANIYQMVEGIEYRIKSYVQSADTFSDFIAQLKTKRYAQVRLQRLLCYLLFQVTDTEMAEAQAQPFIRVLGYTRAGQAYLKQVKGDLSLPLVAKFGKKEAAQYAFSLKVDQIYQLADAGIKEQNFGRQPLFIQN